MASDKSTLNTFIHMYNKIAKETENPTRKDVVKMCALYNAIIQNYPSKPNIDQLIDLINIKMAKIDFCEAHPEYDEYISKATRIEHAEQKSQTDTINKTPVKPTVDNETAVLLDKIEPIVMYELRASTGKMLTNGEKTLKATLVFEDELKDWTEIIDPNLE